MFVERCLRGEATAKAVDAMVIEIGELMEPSPPVEAMVLELGEFVEPSPLRTAPPSTGCQCTGWCDRKLRRTALIRRTRNTSLTAACLDQVARGGLCDL